MKYFLYLIFTMIAFTGCYSFKGISIPPEAESYYVNQVRIAVPEPSVNQTTQQRTGPSDVPPPPDSPERFMEQFRQKIRSQSKLKWDEIDPDIEFSADITGFKISNEGARAGNEVSLNKLTITLKVDYVNNRNEDDAWNKTFSFGLPFDPALDLQDVQDEFIEDIFDQISENIFNDAFTNW